MFDNFKLKLYQNGVMHQLNEIHFPKPICNAEKVYDEVNIEFAGVFFIILSIGVSLAILTGVIEVIYSRLQKEKLEEC